MKLIILFLCTLVLFANARITTRTSTQSGQRIRARLADICSAAKPYLCGYACQEYPCDYVPPTTEPFEQSSSSTAPTYESSTAPSSTAPTYESSSTAPTYESSTAPPVYSTAPPVYVSSSSTAPTYESSTAPTYVSSSSTAPTYESSTAPTYVSSSTAPTYESSTAPIYSSTAKPPESSTGPTYSPPTCATVYCSNGYICQNGECIKGPCYHDTIKIWIDTHRDEYNSWINTAKSLYDQYGYYTDPKKQSSDYKPVGYLNPDYQQYDTCYGDQYSENGYSNYGYDSNNYDPYGYDQAGYDKNGWSRYGAADDTQFNALGKFKNPDYVEQTAYFYPNGTVYLTSDGEVRRFDRYGYDQYGNDVNGKPKPPLCQNEPLSPTIQTQVKSDGLLNTCAYQSEYGNNGKYTFIRKSVTAMTPDDWSRFRAVWNQLNMAGKLGEYSTLYRNYINNYSTVSLFPWSREFIARFENDLHQYDPCVTLPYWDTILSPRFPAGISDGIATDYPPQVRYYSNGQVTSMDMVTRSIGTLGQLPSAPLLTVLMQDSSYASFTGKLEQYLNSIHTYIGGDMSNIQQAAQDPVFYMVRSYGDKIWSEWQATHDDLSDDIKSSIGTLNYGTDTVQYDDIADIATVATSRGIGYTYV